MFRIGIACLLLLSACAGAIAQSSTGRGRYLVNTIMACGNCHTPRDADGKAMEAKAFSGGLTFTTPAFVATAPNITPDVETGIGSWSDAELRRALIERRCEMWVPGQCPLSGAQRKWVGSEMRSAFDPRRTLRR